MQLALPRPLFFMAKAELFRPPLADPILHQLGAFPVRRDHKDRWAYQHALNVLAHGQPLGIFPEGTRSHGRGLGVARTGAAQLAIERGAPIVPMVIIGSDQLVRRFSHQMPITTRLLLPILPYPGETPLALTDP